MFETMHYAIHLEKERGMFRTAETSRQIRLLRSRRKKMRSGKPLFGIPRLVARTRIKQLRHAADSILFPDHHGLHHS